MYSFVLALHSWLRWAALIAAVLATLAVLVNRPSAASTGRTDRLGLALVIALDLQMLLGLLLYVALSPTTAAIFQNFGASMRDPVARFWAVEHIAMMLASVILVHLGRVLARKAATPAAKRTRLLVCYGLATVLMLAGTPWPGMASGRRLFPL